MTESNQGSSVPGWPAPGRTHPQIAVVGPNPAMDRTEEIEAFRPHEVNRALVSSPRAGGKSFIVARVLRRLERPVSLYGFLGGATGQYLRAECEKLGIGDRHTAIDGETRINTVMVDRQTGRATVVNEPGPVVSEAEADALRSAVSDDLAAGDILILAGSLPRGVTTDFYADLISLARARGALPIVDADGDVLTEAVAAHPWAVKCNLHEFRAVGSDVPVEVVSDADRARLVEAMRAVVATGVRLVIVTLGADGLIAATDTEVFRVVSAQVDTKNPTGSGDTFIAAFACACMDGASLEEALRFGAAAASANAAVLVPDIGPSPVLEPLIARTSVQRIALDLVPVASGADQ